MHVGLFMLLRRSFQMANVTPILQKKKVVKRAKKFARYQAHQFMRVDVSDKHLGVWLR